MTDKLNKKIKLNTEPYKGVLDFYPEEQALQNYIFNKMRKTAESFGYIEYSASILEPTELYEAKSGEELIKEQTYTFKDRGDRSVTLRPEITPTITRMIAQKRRELGFPLRWYTIANVFRYERPQRGRLREHWQLNADLFGVSGIEADVEIISLAYQTLKDMGAKDSDFKIKINYAGILSKYIKKEFILNDEETNTLIKIIDRYGKISDEDFKERASKILKESEILKLFNKIKTQDNGPSAMGEREFKQYKEITYLKDLKNKLSKFGINIIIDPFLTRGFDYYTGMVFEVYDTNPKNNRSMFGGGRYDNLLEIFGADKIPAIGFGMGDVTIRNFLETRELLPKYIYTTDLMLCVLNKKNIDFAKDLAVKLRKQELNVSVNLSDKKINEQIRLANKQNIPYIICIGEYEEKTGKFKLKELKTGKEEEVVSENEIINIIK